MDNYFPSAVAVSGPSILIHVICPSNSDFFPILNVFCIVVVVVVAFSNEQIIRRGC